MRAEARQKIQLFLIAAIAIAAVRTGYILYQRHEESRKPAKQEAPPLNPDYYVSPRKLHPYDVKSAQQLTQQPVWVKEGYRYTYYPYDTARHRTNTAKEAGTLLPLQKLEIKNVALDSFPQAPGQRQVVAVFEQDGKSYAVPIGVEKGGSYNIYADEMLFIQDPHQLYQHWPAGMWQAIDAHQAKPGMNELQATFAIGMGTPESSGDSSMKTVHYPNGGKPLTITYRNGRAEEIKPGA